MIETKTFILISFCLALILIFSGYAREVPKAGRFDRSAFGCATSIETKIVRGDSMSPFLKNGDEVRAEFGYYDCHLVSRGDVVLVRSAGRENFLIKMIRAIPGDRLSFSKTSDTQSDNLEEGSEAFVNGEKLLTASGTPYRFRGQEAKMLRLYEGVIPENAYLVLGENPAGSYDGSRFGLITKGNITAKAEKRP